jgi:hypothetical protein
MCSPRSDNDTFLDTGRRSPTQISVVREPNTMIGSRGYAEGDAWRAIVQDDREFLREH